MAVRDWHRFDGEMALRGIDPIELPLHRFVNLVYAWLLEGRDVESRRKLDRDLFEPPPSASSEQIANLPEWSPEAQAQSFMAAMSSRAKR